MLLTILFDLDETLLTTNMDRFLPAYFNALGKALTYLGPEKKITAQIHAAVKVMFKNQDPGRTLKEIFDANFYAQLGTTEEACQQTLAAFYSIEYPQLKSVTQSKPEASELVQWCLSKGLGIAVATNPLFPHTATRQRIEWAGLHPDDIAFFTSYNDFHFTKPHLAYYAEVLGRLGWPQTPVVMIGDNLSDDLFPMDAMGATTYWVHQDDSHIRWEGGTLSEVKPWLSQVMRNSQPSLTTSPEVHCAILRATPAVIDTWLRQPIGSDNGNLIPDEQLITTLLGELISIEERVFAPFWQQVKHNPSGASTAFESLTNAIKPGKTLQDPQHAFNHFLTARCETLSILEDYYHNRQSGDSDSIHTVIDQMISWMTLQDRKLLRNTLSIRYS